MNIINNIVSILIKQKSRGIGIFLFLLLNITMVLAQNQPIEVLKNGTSFPGYGFSCSGEISTYTLQNAVNGVTYTWSLYPAGQSSMVYLPNNQVQIQWFGLNSNYIFVHGSDGSYSEYEENLLLALNPFITTNSEVGCQIVKKRDVNSLSVDDENGCMNVCENSTVNYHANSIPSDTYGSFFEWTVVGGVFSPSGLTTLTGTQYVPLNDVTVAWGSMGAGSITVKESNLWGCPPAEKTICIEKIEIPRANFIFDNVSPDDLPQNECYKVCQNQEVNFIDLSTASTDSPIMYYEWFFDDNSPNSALQNPSHIYNTPGFHKVTLIITNKCGCSNRYYRYICVSEDESPQIFCPSVICEDKTAIYHTNSSCNPYEWKIIGGTQQLPQTGSEVAVIWDQVGPDGFGYVSLNGENCEGKCTSWSTIRVPVVKAIGTIVGSTTVCPNSHYRYKLPAWPATNFTWEVIDNYNTGTLAISHLENSNELEIVTGEQTGSFEIRCTYVNTIVDCAGSARLRVDLREKPIIHTPSQSCINSTVTCTLENYNSGAGTTTWSAVKPDGSVFTVNSSNGQNQLIFPASTFAVEGNYTIRVSNPSDFCDPDPVMVKVKNKPAAPTAISGDEKVCLYYPYTYTADYLAETVTNWIIVGGVASGTTSTTSIGNSVAVVWNTTGTKTLTAFRTWEDIPGCSSEGFVKTIHQIVLTGQIIGTDNPCEDATYNYALNLNNGATGEVYEWSVSPSSMGSINSGQGTTSCNVTFNHYAPTSASGTIVCKVTKCGGTTTFIRQVGVQMATSITALTANPASLCSGVPTGIAFTVTTAEASASSFIWDFGDGQTATTSTNQTNHVYTNTTNDNQTFVVSVKAVSSCNGTISAAATTNVIVHAQPNASISPGGVTLLCPGDSWPLVTTISNTSTGNFGYQWYQNGVLIPGATGLSYPVNSVGDYYAVVTNTEYGCTTKTNVRTVVFNPNCNPNCTPVGPAGISNFDVELIGCGMIQATCNTAGTIGGNIISYQWELVAPGINPIPSGTETINSSHIYAIDKPGEYQVKLHVTYQNSDPNGDPCVITSFGNIIVPVIADFKWGMACVGNNGYIVTLTDNSAVYGNMYVSSRQWKINNMVQANVSSTFEYTVPSNLLGTNLTVDITVDNGSGFPCTATQAISVPNLPVADFTTITTNNTFPSSRSCEGREVVFTNTSSPMATIISNIWDFGDQTSFHGMSPIKEYTINTASAPENVTLTITDKYNCNNTKSINLTIDKNYLSAQSLSNSFYTINPTTPPCYVPGQTVNVAVNLNGGSPNAFEWYKEVDQITAPNLANINVNSQGAYWVKMYNDKFCYKAINPTPAVVSFRYPTQAIITGKQDACTNTPFVLKAPKVTGLTYSWVRNPGNIACGNTQTITQNLSTGVYTYTLTLTQTGGCASTSAPFLVIVHSLPQPPVITENVVNCDSYRIDLTAISPIASSFTWSTGQNSASIQVAHGGPYRTWITDEFGCENYADIDVPVAPNTYFWRFPKGCYSFCPGDLPRWVDGPSHVKFKYWEWLISREGNTDIVDPNNNMGGSGYSSTCAPLWIDFPPLGSGSGDYQWGLNTGLCYQRSEIMSVNLREKCCDIEMRDLKIKCIDGLYYFSLNVYNNADCPNAYYNFSLLDANTLQPIGSFSSLSPNALALGWNTIQGSFITVDPVTFTISVILKIDVFCNDKEHCIGTIATEISKCVRGDGKAMEMTNKKAESDYITELNIAPNPANATLNIGYRFMDENPAIKRNIQIYDVVGRPIENIMINNSAGTYALDVSKYSQGVYFVEMRENNQHLLMKRIVINH